MGKRFVFTKQLVEKAFQYSIHISILVIAVAVIFGDLLLIDPQNMATAWAELAPVEKVDAKKVDVALNYLNKITPPLSGSTNSQQGALGLLSGDDGFFSKPLLLNTIVSGLERDRITTYTVSEGETYWTIAYKYEITIDTLRWANNISDLNTVKPGEELIIPPANGLVHVVKEDDSIERIAAQYSVSRDLILQKNKLADASISTDQKIFIPGARKYTAPSATSANTALFGYNFWDGPIQTGTGNFLWPVRNDGRFISQYFGWVTSTYKHTGLDLDARNGRDVIAADSGTVVAVVYGWGGGYGNHAIIDHGNGYQTLYGHFESIGLNVGQNVERGQSLGVMGTTGASTGVHVHFEIRYNGVALNPLAYVR